MVMVFRWLAAILTALMLMGIAGWCGAQVEWTDLPPVDAPGPTGVDLVADSGFEQPDDISWRFSDWPPRENTSDRLIAKSVYYSESVVRNGNGALCIDLTTVGEGRYLAAKQNVPMELLKRYDGRRIRMSASGSLAKGPPGYQGRLTIRQWGERGRPPLSHHTVRVPSTAGVWTDSATEFTLRVGETQRVDFGITLAQVADLTTSPVVYLDDIRLQVLLPPDLGASLECGSVLSRPDTIVPVRAAVSDAAWDGGLRHLCWYITTPDGARSCRGGMTVLDASISIIDIDTAGLPPDLYGIRLALGDDPNGSTHEALLVFRIAEGPHVR